MVQQKVVKLEDRISNLESDLNKKDQYNQRNNIEIQRLQSDTDDSLDDKVTEMLVEVHVVATKSNTEDCHILCKNGINIVPFVNRKYMMTLCW